MANANGTKTGVAQNFALGSDQRQIKGKAGADFVLATNIDDPDSAMMHNLYEDTSEVSPSKRAMTSDHGLDDVDGAQDEAGEGSVDDNKVADMAALAISGQQSNHINKSKTVDTC